MALDGLYAMTVYAEYYLGQSIKEWINSLRTCFRCHTCV